MNKYYVVNGEHRYMTLAETPLAACVSMMMSATKSGGQKIFDHYFYVDERGYRGKGESAGKRIHVDMVFKAAGFDVE